MLKIKKGECVEPKFCPQGVWKTKNLLGKEVGNTLGGVVCNET